MKLEDTLIERHTKGGIFVVYSGPLRSLAGFEIGEIHRVFLLGSSKKSKRKTLRKKGSAKKKSGFFALVF